MTSSSTRGLSAQVSRDLGQRIVSGALGPGSLIGVEQLERDFGVSRTVVRETFKILADKGLLDARPRIGTYVLPRERWDLLDADVMRWRSSGGMGAALAKELDELRHMVEPWAAGVAARRRTAEDVADMRTALDRMRTAFLDHRSRQVNRLAEHVDADVAFHTAILAATRNELVLRMSLILRPMLEFRDALIPEGQQNEEFLQFHEAVLRAIEARDAGSAQAAMASLLDAAAADVARLVIHGKDS